MFESTGAGTTDWHAQLVGEGSNKSGRGNQIWDVVWKGPSSGKGVLELSMGRPKDLEQWMALVKIACKIHLTISGSCIDPANTLWIAPAPWMGPIHGTTSFVTSKDALLVLYQRGIDGKHVVVLPLSGLGGGSAYVTSDSKGKGEIIVRGMDDFETERKVQVIVAIGRDPLETVASAVAHLKKLVMGSGGMGSEAGEVGVAEDRSMWEDGVSYCTWNGLGWDLSEKRIFDALEQLEKAGVKGMDSPTITRLTEILK